MSKFNAMITEKKYHDTKKYLAQFVSLILTKIETLTYQLLTIKNSNKVTIPIYMSLKLL